MTTRTDKGDCFEDRMATLWALIDDARSAVETEHRRAKGKTRAKLYEVSDLLLDAAELVPCLTTAKEE